MPTLTDEVYATSVLRWLTILLQFTFIGFAITIDKITAFSSNQSWLEVLFLGELMLAIVPVFNFGSQNPKGWKNLSTNTFFMACSE